MKFSVVLAWYISIFSLLPFSAWAYKEKSHADMSDMAARLAISPSKKVSIANDLGFQNISDTRDLPVSPGISKETDSPEGEKVSDLFKVESS
jgi:hypothetical protein|tara:strand:+ start:1179 stop:1454 length:276 start_codon:yes stop_codon:yes gene_type:complete